MCTRISSESGLSSASSSRETRAGEDSVDRVKHHEMMLRYQRHQSMITFNGLSKRRILTAVRRCHGQLITEMAGPPNLCQYYTCRFPAGQARGFSVRGRSKQATIRDVTVVDASEVHMGGLRLTMAALWARGVLKSCTMAVLRRLPRMR